MSNMIISIEKRFATKNSCLAPTCDLSNQKAKILHEKIGFSLRMFEKRLSTKMHFLYINFGFRV